MATVIISGTIIIVCEYLFLEKNVSINANNVRYLLYIYICILIIVKLIFIIVFA